MMARETTTAVIMTIGYTDYLYVVVLLDNLSERNGWRWKHTEVLACHRKSCLMHLLYKHNRVYS